jgi:Tfp pilus assembly protein PilN
MIVTIDLLPEERKNEIKKKKFFILVIKQEILFTFSLIFFIIFLMSLNFIIKYERDSMVSVYSDEQTINKGDELKKYEEKFKEINKKVASVSDIYSKHLFWSSIFYKLSESVPDGITISHLATNNYQISIVGNAKKRDDFLKFEENMAKAECFTDMNAPLSNLVVKENVDFQIDFTIKKECLKEK